MPRITRNPVPHWSLTTAQHVRCTWSAGALAAQSSVSVAVAGGSRIHGRIASTTGRSSQRNGRGTYTQSTRLKHQPDLIG